MLSTSSSRDYSRWVIPGRIAPLLKGPFLLAVFEDHIANALTLSEIQQVFRELARQPASIGNRATHELRHKVKDEIRFSLPPIRTADGQLIRISNQWSFANFPFVLKAVHQHFGIPLQGCRVSEKMSASMHAAGANFQKIDC